jgi:serine/threonine protein kinase
MKRTTVAGILILLSLIPGLVALASVLLAPPIRALAGLLVIVSTVVAADLVTTGLRRRARRASLPEVAEQVQPVQQEKAPTLPAPVKPGEELWLPPLPEPGTEMWVVPPLPGAEETREAGATPVSATDLVGQKVGPYQVLEKIGQGGMATVYRGFHAELDRYVAIKVLAGALPTTPELLQRFQREARTIAALRHPNIVQVYDFGPLGDTYYLAMEYVEGSDLAVEMRRRREAGRPFRREEILHLLSRVSEALDYAHSQGVIHRDVKPGNILLTSGGQPILTDFGLATLRRTRATLITTIGQNVLGTPEYTAPEQALDAQAAGPQSDLYSLGCILYELVTGHLPFESESPLSIALMHISQEPPPPRQHVPELPAAVEAVILRAMARKPEERYATAGEMVHALRRAWEGET